jgi:hypothetical protein
MPEASETNVRGGLLTGASALRVIVRPNTNKFMRIVGYRLQIYGVTTPGVVELKGRNGTVVSAPVYADSNGINYVQDGINIPLAVGESLMLSNTTDGNVRWAVSINEFDSTERGAL